MTLPHEVELASARRRLEAAVGNREPAPELRRLARRVQELERRRNGPKPTPTVEPDSLSRPGVGSLATAARLSCGHPASELVASDEGSSYCAACEYEAREGWQVG
ncbi:MAG: hypothetical protein ACREMD_00840 [Gemmatimonadota bacterium]